MGMNASDFDILKQAAEEGQNNGAGKPADNGQPADGAGNGNLPADGGQPADGANKPADNGQPADGAIVTGKQIGRASCRERVSSPV